MEFSQTFLNCEKIILSNVQQDRNMLADDILRNRIQIDRLMSLCLAPPRILYFADYYRRPSLIVADLRQSSKIIYGRDFPSEQHGYTELYWVSNTREYRHDTQNTRYRHFEWIPIIWFLKCMAINCLTPWRRSGSPCPAYYRWHIMKIYFI